MENRERVERELLEQCGQVATLAECFAWLQRCDECIERLEELCRAKRAVINSNHIEPRQFLEDAGNIVFERVQDAVERHGSVKVNTAFNGEFATKDKRTNKSIITKNNEIHRCTDIRECMEHRAVRLLSRRYNLTNTGYKYLEIGIHVGPPSYVEIALGDNRGHELSLSLETWKGLYEQRWNIYKMLRNEHNDIFISVEALTVRVCTMNDATLMRLDSSSVRITMTETTLRRMFAFDGCIDVTFERLVRLVDTVDVKYTRFSNIASEDAIRDSNVFNKYQLVDCELLALIFNTREKTRCSNMRIKIVLFTSNIYVFSLLSFHPSIHSKPRHS
ncbi:hypothetical protein ALC57_15712 [Trachymyrmex cornetzi]|uniref:Uncharacterized protein n=1 Tax=Trachymyrmex cornetzi TaxID=471704 RepID=A0A151IWB6_9HYME|nr:hypothetical protein ALC57_15712 [Trachymyrmex cornetzi]